MAEAVAFTAAVINVEDSAVEDSDVAVAVVVVVVVVVIAAIGVMVVVVLVTDPLESLLYKKKPLRCDVVGV